MNSQLKDFKGLGRKICNFKPVQIKKYVSQLSIESAGPREAEIPLFFYLRSQAICFIRLKISLEKKKRGDKDKPIDALQTNGITVSHFLSHAFETLFPELGST